MDLTRNEKNFDYLFSSYSLHHKPYYSNDREGINYYLLRFQTEGTCYAWQNNNYVFVQPGDLLLYQPGDSYELTIGYKNPKPQEPLDKFQSGDYHLLAKGSWMDNWWNSNNRPGIVNIGQDQQIISIWRQLVLEKRKMNDQIEEVIIHLSKALLYLLDRSIKERHNLSAKSRQISMAHRMKYFVEKHATEIFTIQDVADYVDLSVSRAVHLFKETFGQTIIDYMIMVRLSLARERIEHSTLKLEQIAELCGFQSYTYFYRTFKSRLGLSPQQYRDQTQTIVPPND